MKHVKRYRDRQGADRLYFRKAGHPRNGEPLASRWPDVAEGSALQAEVAAILATQTVKPRPGYLAGATRAYELSADFIGLGAETKYGYRQILKEFDADLGPLPLATFTPAFILSLRDAWASRGYRAANMRLQVLKNVMEPHLVAADLPDPFSRIRQVRRPRDAAEPHPIWTEAAVRIVIEEAIRVRRFGIARAVAVARYTGARRGDLVRIARTARQDGRIGWLSGKRKVPVSMPEDPLLTARLEATPAQQPLSKWQRHVQRKTGVVRLPPATLIFNSRNRPYTEDGLGQELAKIVSDLHTAGRLETDRYDLHGLRHTFGVEAALAGCSDAQGGTLMGHGSPNSFATYRRQAARLQLSDDGAALVAALRERTIGTATERDVSNDCLKVSNSAAPITRLGG
jgi:integrase